MSSDTPAVALAKLQVPPLYSLGERSETTYSANLQWQF